MGVSMLLVVILLVVIILILMFGAQAVKSGLANGCVMLLLGAVLVEVFVVAQGMTAEQWSWLAGSVALLVTVVCGYLVWSEKRAQAEIYGKDKGAQGSKGTLPKKPEPQTPLESLMHVFEEYDSRTVPATKIKAQELYARGDEDGLRQLVESICERNQDHLEFDGERYSRRAHWAGGRF